MKNKIFEFVGKKKAEIIKMSDYIFDNPELGGQEYKAASLLTSYLFENGFKVEMPIGGLDTAFRAIYESGNGGPSIGLLCEYDAIEGIGHACGHHMQGPSIIYAAVALKEILEDVDYKIIVYGTPAEETLGSKIQMIDEGYFKDIDVALMMHAGPTTTTDIKSLALSSFTVNFYGISTHAAIKPEEGRSALDGILMLANGIEFLREHVKDDVRIHYSIKDGGGPPNVIPKFASAEFALRSYDRVYLDTVIERFKKIVKGAALITETKSEIVHKKSMNNKIPVLLLNKILMDNAKHLEAPCIRPPREKTGSTDFGNVMYLLPGSCIRVAFVPEGTSSHSQQYIEAGKSEDAHNAEILATKILAASAYDLIRNQDLLNEVKKEFIENKNTGLIKT